MTEPKQEFIGGLIVGKVVESIAGKALDKVLNRAAKSPTISLEKKDVPELKQKLEQAMETDVQSRVDHATNNEPLYKSRVTLGSVFAIFAAATAIGQLYSDGVINTWDDYAPHVSVVAGALFALYGRFIAKKPLGE